MRFRLILCLALVLIVAACQGPPPTMVVLVVTATPDANAAAEATSDLPPETEASPMATATPTEILPTPLPSLTPTLDPRPTATTGQIQVAEQVFEHGRMFWIQPREQIWILFDDGQGKGVWSVYEDTFQDGEPESDPSIVPPADKYQPLRGFGKLWRETPDIMNRLGFGVTPEFGYVSNYEYHPGGQLNSSGIWEAGPGYHILFSLYNEKFQFNETDGTWQKIQ